MPLLHGSQGCTSFGLVLFVRHFKEAIPLQTTAMSEVATVLGGYENVEQAILNIIKRTKPEIIGICSTGVTETKGDDVDGYIELIRQNHPELAEFPAGLCLDAGFQGRVPGRLGKDGHAAWSRSWSSRRPMPARRDPDRVNVLPGCHLTPGDIDELRTIIEDFGLEPTFLPDLGGSLDGHIPDDFTPTTIGGVGVDEDRDHGRRRLDHRHRRADARARPRRCRRRPAFPSACSSGCAASSANDELMAFLTRNQRAVRCR